MSDEAAFVVSVGLFVALSVTVLALLALDVVAEYLRERRATHTSEDET